MDPTTLKPYYNPLFGQTYEEDKPEFDVNKYNTTINELCMSLKQGNLNEQAIKTVEEQLLIAMKENPEDSLIPYILSRLYLLEAKFRKKMDQNEAGLVATINAFNFHNQSTDWDIYNNHSQKFDSLYRMAIHLSPYGREAALQAGFSTFYPTILSYLDQQKSIQSRSAANKPDKDLWDQHEKLLTEPDPSACGKAALEEINFFRADEQCHSVDMLICAAQLLKLSINSQPTDHTSFNIGSSKLIGKCYEVIQQRPSSENISCVLKVLTIIAPHHPMAACLLGILGMNHHLVNLSPITSVAHFVSSQFRPQGKCLLLTPSQINTDQSGFLKQVHDIVALVNAHQKVDIPDLNKSIQYLIYAANNEDAFAQTQLKQLMEHYHTTLLLSADSETLFSLAQICHEGKLIPQNIPHSILFFKKAADQGNVQAALILSEISVQQANVDNSMAYLIIAIQNNMGAKSLRELDEKQKEFNKQVQAKILALLTSDSDKVSGKQCFKLSQLFKNFLLDPDQTTIYLKMAAEKGYREAMAELRKWQS